MQVLALIPRFAAAIAAQTLAPNLEESSFCIAFLKLFIPAIAQTSAEPDVVLDVTSVRHGGLNMSLEDRADFVRRLTIRHDAGYDIGQFADPVISLSIFSRLFPLLTTCVPSTPK